MKTNANKINHPARFASRKAIGVISVVGLLLGLLDGAAFAQTVAPASPSKSQTIDREIELIAKESSEAVRREIATVLYPRAVDTKRGGFHQTYSVTWDALPDTSLSIVAQSRHAWTCANFSKFEPSKGAEFQKYALDGLLFIDRAFYDSEQGGYYWSVGADGKANASIGYVKHAYGTSFAIYAAAEVYHVTHDARALEIGKKAFDWLEKYAHDSVHGGYYEVFDRSGKAILNPPTDAQNWQKTDPIGTHYGFKTMNSHIHLLEAFAEWSHCDDRPIVRQRFEEVFKLVRDRIAVEPGCLCLYFTPDWRATAAHDSFGHDIETAYLLVEAAHLLGIPEDTRTWEVAKSLVDHALDWGFDHEQGGFYDKGDAWGNIHDKNRIWWVQAEGLNALAVMHAKYGKESDRYRQALIRQWEFISKYSLDQTNGGWYWEINESGKPIGETQKTNGWKTAYHTGRSLMNTYRLLSETTKK